MWQMDDQSCDLNTLFFYFLKLLTKETGFDLLALGINFVFALCTGYAIIKIWLTL